MRFRWRLWYKKLQARLIPFFTVVVHIINKSVCLMLIGLTLLSLLWWIIAGEEPLCDGEIIQKKLCEDFAERSVSGSLCRELCTKRVYQLSGCDDNNGKKTESAVKTYRILHHGSRIGLTAFYSDLDEKLKEGTPFNVFLWMVKRSLHQFLGRDADVNVLSQLLFKDFDVNSDSRLDYGEANSLWKLLHQPQFLNNYILQDTGVVPTLNGTCGGMSLWSDYDRNEAMPLYSRNSLWPFSLLYSNAYRMTLPNWSRRAKVMLSLFEFAEDAYETSGVRFHLCNITSENLYYYSKKYEVLISDQTGLMSAHQIQLELSNRTCRHDRDCLYSRQCSARCNTSSQACTGALARPTVVNICDIVEEYLLFDAPKALEGRLFRNLRQCRDLAWFSSNIDIQHSILILDLKNMLWSHLQNIKL